MSEILQSMNANTGLLTVTLTAVMVILTWLYVHYTKKILQTNQKTIEEVREQAWLASRAYMVVRIVFKHKYVCALELANEGKSSARNVRLSLDRDVFQGGDPKRRINDLPVFARALDAVPPGIRSSVYLWPGTIKPGTELYPDKFKITATYETLGRNIAEETTLDVYLYTEFPAAPTEESLETIAGSLEEIKKVFDKLGPRLQFTS